MIGPRAAQGGFPYPHRTIAQVWAHEAKWRSEFNKGGADPNDKRAGLSYDHGQHGEKRRASLPESACPNCGARGFCGHHGRIAA